MLMTATINVYNMPQVVTLTLGGDTGATLMNYPVNRTDFKLTKGVTTEVLFFIKDVDRKSSTVDGTPKVVISDTRQNRVLLERNLVQRVIGTQTLWVLSIAATDIVDWPLGFLRYSMVVDRGADEVMLYSDRAYQGYSQCQVIEGPYPDPPEPITVTEADMTILSGELVSGAYPGAASVGNVSGLHGVVLNVTDFVGQFYVEGSLEAQPSTHESDWFTAHGQYFGQPTTGPIQFDDVIGNYVWIRFVLLKESGEFHSVTLMSH